MARTFFSDIEAMKRQFFITGLTADEFYTDSGRKLNIEQLLHSELKQNGYKRIIFLDPGKYELYCYDDESYELMKTTGAARKAANNGAAVPKKSLLRKNGGLGMGKHIKRASEPNDQAQNSDQTTQSDTDIQSNVTNDKWKTGEHSGIMIRNYANGPLMLGISDKVLINRQIDGYMRDHLIKTAIIINDADVYISDFGHPQLHSFIAEYERLGSQNRNIIIFIHSDIKMPSAHLNVTKGTQYDDTDENNRNQAFGLPLRITAPNAAELKNLLMYQRVNHGLKVKLSTINKTAMALTQAMSGSKDITHLKMLVPMLEKYGTEKEFNEEACYTMLGTSKPSNAREQLDQMIGLTRIKETLAKYNVNTDEEKLSALNYLTASRVKPNLENPNVEKDMIHFALLGNPGTGKTTVARLIGQMFFEMGYLDKGHVVETGRSELVSNHIGETAINTRKKIEEALGGVLFIDEAYSLKRNKNDDVDFGQEAIDTLTEYMTRYAGRFILVAAGYPQDMETFIESNQGLGSRFTKLYLDDYTPEEMCEILKQHAHRKKAVFSEQLEAALPDFCENWVNLSDEDWGNARESEQLVKDMLREWKNDPQKKTEGRPDGVNYAVLTKQYIPEKLAGYLQPVSEMRAQALQNLNAMTGLSNVKKCIERLRRRMLSGDQTEPGHYIFTGNPGTGKTTVARIMGQMLRNLGMLKKGHLKEYTVNSLKAEVFNEDNNGDFEAVANKALDGVLFIDEAYQLAEDNTVQSKLILDSLLTFVENNRKRVCVILAGYEDNMYDFLRTNPGLRSRFNEPILFENYSGEELCAILLKNLDEQGISYDEDYKEFSLRALTRYVKAFGKDKTFGNARFIRTDYLPASLDRQTDRLIEQYGEDFPRELKKQLTGEDIPEKYEKYTKTLLEKPDTRSAAEKIESLIGYEPIKAELRRLIKTAEFNRTNSVGVIGMPQNLNWILEGNPGTGKTTIARLIGQVYKECGILSNGKTHEVSRADLVAGYEGQTAIKVKNAVEKAMGGVLFIDEAYSLTEGENSGANFGQEAITELVKAMEDYRGELAVICAGYPYEMEQFIKSNPGITSRMKKYALDDYTPEELAQIFRHMCREDKTVIETELDSKLELFFTNKMRTESKKGDWGNARECRNLLEAMQDNWMNEPVFSEAEDGSQNRLLSVQNVPDEQMRYLKGTLSKKSEDEKTSAMNDINHLIGFNTLKEKLLDLIALINTAKESDNDALLEDLNFHWILRGNPGTGKTTVAKIIGKVYKELGLLSRGHTVKVTRKDLVAPYLGQTAPRTQECVDRAMGGVLFIDEAYSLAETGYSGGDAYGQECINTLLEQMSDRNGEFAVIAAGYPREMQTFIDTNPGFASRFAEDIILEDYTAEELVRIFELKIKKINIRIEENTRQTLIQLFENMIAARIKNWANGREAENLARDMKMRWARDPDIRINQETGAKEGYFTETHIPKEYARFLAKKGPSEKKPSSVTPGVAPINELRLPADKLPKADEKYSFEDNSYLEQTKSVVLITAVMGHGAAYGTGSLITADGYILTCNHVVAGSTEIKVRTTLKTDEQEAHWEEAAIMWNDPGMDLAVIKIPGEGYEPLALRRPDKETATGEATYLWGYPFGQKLNDDINELHPSLFQGYVSSVQTQRGLKTINVNIEGKRGCSGGPVLSKEDGTIMGVFCGSHVEGDDKLVEELNFTRPVSYVWDAVTDAGTKSGSNQ